MPRSVTWLTWRRDRIAPLFLWRASSYPFRDSSLYDLEINRKRRQAKLAIRQFILGRQMQLGSEYPGTQVARALRARVRRTEFDGYLGREGQWDCTDKSRGRR
jgi:hypothetical protein